jgi:WD40 repeat protein
LPAQAARARVEFSADGRVLLALVNGTPTAGWPVSDTPERRLFDGHTRGAPAVVFSPDSRRLVSVSKDRTVRIWDAATGQTLRTLTGHPGEIEAGAFNPDGSLLATGDLGGTIRVWGVECGDLLAEVRPGGSIWRLQFSPAGEYLAAGGEHVFAWKVQRAPGRVTLERFCKLASPTTRPDVIDLAVRPGGAELVYLDRSGRLFSHDLAHADGPRFIGSAQVALRSLHFTPGGDRLTFSTPGGALGLWDWAEKTSVDTHQRAESIALSADGRWAAVAGAEQRVIVVDLTSGREVLALPSEESDIWSITWAPDGTRLAVGLSDGRVALWDLEQVRGRLGEFGFAAPSTARADGAPPPAPVPALDQMMRLNQLRAESDRAHRLAAAARDAGDLAGERDHLVTALKLDERLVEAAPDTASQRNRLSWTHGALAHVLGQLGETGLALTHLDTADGLLKRLTLDDPGNPEYRRLRASHLATQSRVLERGGRKTEAIEAARQAAAGREELAADPGSPNDRDQLGVAYHNLGWALARAGKPAEAEQWYKKTLASREQLAHDLPALAQGTRFRASKGGTLLNLGVLRAQARDAAGAVKVLGEAAPILAGLADEFPTNAAYASSVGRSLDWLGTQLRDVGRLDESAQQLREAARRQRAALALRPKDAMIRMYCCNHLAQLAVTLQRMSRPAEAAEALREIPVLSPDNPDELLRAARLLARSATLSEQDSGPPCGLGLALARVYAGEAIGLARRAAAKGLTDVTPLLSDPDFDPVREHDEFRQLLEELMARR